MQSVKVYSQSSRSGILSQMSHVLSDISCQIAYYTKNVIITFKILISKWRWLGPCASWFTKDQEGRKLYWASGNKVLDTFSSMTICCLCHANVIMPSAMRLEFSNSRVAPSQVTKMSLTTLHICEGLSTRLVLNMCYAVPGLCIWTLSSISIWGLLVSLLTVCVSNCFTDKQAWC